MVVNKIIEIMNKYEITHKGQKHIVRGNNLIKTLIAWCDIKGVDANEVESIVKIKEKKPKGLKHTLISDVSIEPFFDKMLDKENPKSFEIRITFVPINEKGAKNVYEFFNGLVEIHHTK